MMDLWFVGGSPYAVAAIWAGHPNYDKQMNDRDNGHKLIWQEIMSKYLETKEQKSFTDDPNVFSASYCNETGDLAVPGVCTSTRTGWYTRDNMPGYCDGAHAAVSSAPSSSSEASSETSSLPAESEGTSTEVSSEPSSGAESGTVSQASSLPESQPEQPSSVPGTQPDPESSASSEGSTPLTPRPDDSSAAGIYTEPSAPGGLAGGA